MDPCRWLIFLLFFHTAPPDLCKEYFSFWLMLHPNWAACSSLDMLTLAGPRRPGEGIEDEAQGIVDVHETANGYAVRQL